MCAEQFVVNSVHVAGPNASIQKWPRHQSSSPDFAQPRYDCLGDKPRPTSETFGSTGLDNCLQSPNFFDNFFLDHRFRIVNGKAKSLKNAVTIINCFIANQSFKKTGVIQQTFITMGMIIYVDVLNPLTPKIVLEILPSGSYTCPPK